MGNVMVIFVLRTTLVVSGTMLHPLGPRLCEQLDHSAEGSTATFHAHNYTCVLKAGGPKTKNERNKNVNCNRTYVTKLCTHIGEGFRDEIHCQKFNNYFGFQPCSIISNKQACFLASTKSVDVDSATVTWPDYCSESSGTARKERLMSCMMVSRLIEARRGRLKKGDTVCLTPASYTYSGKQYKASKTTGTQVKRTQGTCPKEFKIACGFAGGNLWEKVDNVTAKTLILRADFINCKIFFSKLEPIMMVAKRGMTESFSLLLCMGADLQTIDPVAYVGPVQAAIFEISNIIAMMADLDIYPKTNSSSL